MKAIDLLFGKPTETRGLPAVPDQWVMFGSSVYRPMFSYSDNKVSAPDGSFEPLVRQLHDSHPIISAAVIKRAGLLSELVFQWRSVLPQDNGKLFGNAELGVLERPNRWQTSAEFLKTVEYHASYAGAAYIHRDGASLRLLNPSWTSIVLGSQRDADDPAVQRDADVIGYLYQPGGSPTYGDPEYIDAAQVAVYRPEPDPVCPWKGRSWVQSVISEWVTDTAATQHTHAYFEHAATPNLVFSLDATVTKDQVQTYAEMVASGHGGAANAYKSIVLGGGADVTVVGSDLASLDLKNVQGLTETRIAARAQVPAVILQISEGMQGSSLNSGNYQAIRRQFSDTWFTPTANALCAALENILTVPQASTLSFDPSRIMFLQDDRKDEADILAANAAAIRQLVDAGYDPPSVVQAILTSDLSKLNHSGLYSVQLQPPGTEDPSDTEDPGERPARAGVDADGVTRFVVTAPVEVPTPHITVNPTPVTVEAPVVNVQPPAVNVEAPIVNVPEPVVRMDTSTVTKTVLRDSEGRIERVIERKVGVTEEEDVD